MPVCLITAIILHDSLFATFIIIAAFTLIVFSGRQPKLINIGIDQRGIKIEKDMYPFANIDSFWVDASEADSPKILLKSKKIIMPLIVVPIEEYDHMSIREILIQFLPEKEMHEPLSQKIMEKLGF